MLSYSPRIALARAIHLIEGRLVQPSLGPAFSVAPLGLYVFTNIRMLGDDKFTRLKSRECERGGVNRPLARCNPGCHDLADIRRNLEAGAAKTSSQEYSVRSYIRSRRSDIRQVCCQ